MAEVILEIIVKAPETMMMTTTTMMMMMMIVVFSFVT
jgi:hypothetical protein